MHYANDENDLKKKAASLKRYCTCNGLENLKKYFRRSWEPFVTLWVQFFRKDVWTGQAHTNNISEGRVGSFKKGLKTVTDGRIFSAVKYLLETYIPNDFQDFKTLNRNNAWENKRVVNLKGYPLLQNHPPGAVVAINNLYSRAATAIKDQRYRYKSLEQGRYQVTNTKNGHIYSFTLKNADCQCVDSVTNAYKIPCIHAMVLLQQLKLRWEHFNPHVRRNVRNSLVKITGRDWTILGRPDGSENYTIQRFWERVELSPSTSNSCSVFSTQLKRS